MKLRPPHFRLCLHEPILLRNIPLFRRSETKRANKSCRVNKSILVSYYKWFFEILHRIKKINSINHFLENEESLQSTEKNGRINVNEIKDKITFEEIMVFSYNNRFTEITKLPTYCSHHNNNNRIKGITAKKQSNRHPSN